MSEQQHAYLKAMGIDIWVERNPSSQQAEEAPIIKPEPSVQPIAEAVEVISDIKKTGREI